MSVQETISLFPAWQVALLSSTLFLNIFLCVSNFHQVWTEVNYFIVILTVT